MLNSDADIVKITEIMAKTPLEAIQEIEMKYESSPFVTSEFQKGVLQMMLLQSPPLIIKEADFM